MAAKDNVVIRMSAEDAGVFEAWQKAKQGPEAMGDAVEKAGAKGKRATELFGSELLKHVGHWATVAAGIHVAKKALEEYYETKRELEQGEAHASAAADAAMRKYFVTAKLSDQSQQAQSTQRIGAVALKRRASLEEAGAGADLLARFGVSREEAEGGTLDELMQLRTAASASGADPEHMSRRVLEILRRSTPGGKITGKAIRGVGTTMRQLQSSNLGFSDDAFELSAKYGTVLQQAGYDQPTSMALAAAISEKYDPRQSRGIIKEISKPGMQKGEKELLARARGALGTGGAADYDQAVKIGSESVAALGTETEAGVTIAEMGEKKLDTQQIRKRLLAELRASGASNADVVAGAAAYDSPGSWIFPVSWYSDESRVNAAINTANMSGMGKPPEGIRERVLGQQPLTIILKNHEGRSIPHQTEAAGIQGR